MEVKAKFRIKDANEQTAYNQFVGMKDANKIIFMVGTQEKKVLTNVDEINFVGGRDAQGIKTDFEIKYDGQKKFNVSLKKPKFRSWESAESLVGENVAEKILEILLEDLDVAKKNTSKTYQVKPYNNQGKIYYGIFKKNSNQTTSLAFKCNRTDAERVIFGEDILGNGAVVSKDFSNGIMKNNETIIIRCDNYITSMADVGPSIYPYFKVFGTKESRNLYRFPGIRVEAVPENVVSAAVKFNSLR